MDPLNRLAQALHANGVRFVVIGVSGVNYYARTSGTLFTTRDYDLFLPPDPENVLRAWQSCQELDLSLWAGDEPLDSPRDLQLAQAVVARRAATTATGDEDFQIDLSFEMAGFEFEAVWQDRRVFSAEGVEIPVARLNDIVKSKANVGRPKDRLFLASHEHALNELLQREKPPS